MKRKLLLFSLLLALMAPWAAQAQDELTVYEDGTTTNSYVPIYGTWVDNYTRSQFIMPAEELSDMTNGTITSMTFYAQADKNWGAAQFEVYMTETDATTLSALADWSSMTKVMEAASLSITNNIMEVTLDNPYQYGGGNLLIGFYQTVSGTWSGCAWYGVSATGASMGGYGSSISQRDFLPKTTFYYTPGGGPTCNKPDEVIAENITTNSATILWTGGSGTYNVEYKIASDETWTPAVANTTETSVEISGLAPATNYQAKVQSVCVFDDTTLYRDKSVNFRTACGAITNFPWTETFESFAGGDFTDPCWVNEHIEGGGSYIFKIYTSTMSGNSTHMLQLPDMSAGTLTKLVLPEMTLPDDNYEFALQVYRSSNTYQSYPYELEGIRVYASTDGDIEGATELAFIPRHYQVSNAVIPAEEATGWYEYELPIGISGTCYIILRGESQYCTATYMDNFAVQQIPTCPKPRNLSVVANSVTGHEATLRWIPRAEGQTQWQFSLTQNGVEQIVGPVTSTDSTYTLTGLTGVTPYTAKVRAYCSEEDQSPWSNEVSFTTDVTCVAPTAFTTSDVTNRNVKLSWTSEGTDWIVAYKLTSAPDSTYVEVPVTENPYILEGLAPETGYTVKVRNNCGDVDGLSTWTATRTFTTAVAYPTPTNVACTNTTAYSATLTWTELGTPDIWEVMYKLATDTVYDDNNLELADAIPFELGGLSPDTNYVFKVRSIYFTEQGDTASAWSNEVPFTTLQTCPAPTEFAVIDSTINAYGATLNWQSVYSDSWNVKYRTPDYVIGTEEHFNTNSAPQGWTRYSALLSDVLNGGSLGSTTTSGWMFTNTNVFGQYHAKLNIYGTYKYWLVSPELTLADGPGMSFDFALTDFNNADPIEDATAQADDKFVVLIYANDTWTILREWNNSGSEDVFNTIATAGENVSIDLSAYQGQTVQIAFYGESTVSGNGDNDLHIDNVLIGTPVAATEWTEVSADAVPFELTGLNPETYYEVVVSGNCSEEISEESASVFFTTKPSCLAPTDLVVIDTTITAHAATLSWTENGTAAEWVIEYTAVVNDSTTVTNTINVTENPYMLTGLLDGTPYTAKVQAYCSATDQSDWSNTVRFVTPIACPAPTELAVDSITTEGATLTWNGTSESYVVMIGEPDPENLVEGTMLNVDFNNQVIPATWTNDATYPFTVVDGHIQSSNAGVASSTSSISFTMTFDSNVTLEFDAECRGEGSSTYYDHCDFYIDNARQIYAGANISGWNHYTYNVAAGEHTFLWSYTKDTSVNPTGDYFAVDNIMITGLIPTPSIWTEYPAEESPYTFENLEPGTTYFVQVQSNCEGEQPYVSNMISFTTVASCVAPTEVEVTDVAAHTATMVWIGDNDSYLVNLGVNEPIILESADFAEEIPSTWTNSSDYPWAIVDGYIQSTNAGVSSSTSSISTTVTFPAEGTIEFDAECMGEGTSTYWDHCDFYIDGTRVLYHGAELGSGWNHYSYDVPVGEHTFTWSYTKDSSMDPTGDYFAVDNVVMKVSNIVWGEEPYAAADTTYTFNELLAEHTYYTQVQGVCGDEYSEWSEVYSFTTPVACPAPINLAIANVTDSITGHTATINWIETGSATAWEICLNNDENNLILANDTIITLTDLAQDADYSVKVRANCGELDGTSAWSNTVSFHTLVTCAAPTNLTADNIGTESATLMWEGTSDSYVVQLMPWNQVGRDQHPTAEFDTYTYDLSQFSGNGAIAIRHYNCTDNYYLNVDDIVVTNAQGETIFSEDFEGSISSALSVMDMDGDGYNWEVVGTTYHINGSYGIISASYDNNVGALTPDNWLIISGVELGGQLSFAAIAQDDEWINETFGVFVLPEDDFYEEIVDGNTQTDVWDLTPNTTYVWQVKGICGDEESQWVGSSFTTMDDLLVFVTAGDWNDANNWDPAQLPTTDNNVRIDANAIIPAGVVAEAHNVTINGGSITIKDGGQIKQNSQVKVTMEKEITGYGEGEGNGNYYLITSPFDGRTLYNNPSTTWNHVDSLFDGSYDLYTFDPTNGEDEEWVNYKFNSSHINYSSDNGNAGLLDNAGYLYANQGGTTLLFIGTINESIAQTKEMDVVYDSINRGWILVGNPYSCNAYLSFEDGEGDIMEANYYVMNATGDDFELAETANGLAPVTAAFVNFEADGKIIINTEMPNTDKFNRAGKFIMNLSQDGNMVDKAVIRFGKGLNLEKMSLKNNSKLYFSNNDKDYAVVYSSKADNMPVNFKAETAGSYTISFAADGVSFKELVLIDNVNETKVDLLANPSYTFESEAGNFAERFTIVYKVK